MIESFEYISEQIYYTDMTLVRKLRKYVALTQFEFAREVGTSQPTIAAYEAGTKSPTLRTLDGMVTSLGLEYSVNWLAEQTREDRRSLAYHQAVVKKIKSHPDFVLRKARAHLSYLAQKHPDAILLIDRWKLWLRLPEEDLCALMLRKGGTYNDMRQVSPFAGALSASERVAVIHRVRAGCVL